MMFVNLVACLATFVINYMWCCFVRAESSSNQILLKPPINHFIGEEIMYRRLSNKLFQDDGDIFIVFYLLNGVIIVMSAA